MKVTESKRALYVFGSNDGSLLAARSATPRSKFESKSKVNPEISSEDAAPTEVVFGDDGGEDSRSA